MQATLNAMNFIFFTKKLYMPIKLGICVCKTSINLLEFKKRHAPYISATVEPTCSLF